MHLGKELFVWVKLVVILFCAIFTPDFFPFSMRYLIIIFCGLSFCWNAIRTKKITIPYSLIKILKGFAPFIVYLFVNQFIQMLFDFGNKSAYINTLIHTLCVFIAAFLIGNYLFTTCEKNNISNEKLCGMLIIVALIQLVCVGLSLAVPSIRQAFNSLIIKNSYSDRLAALASASNSGWVNRSYGLSNNLFDSFGFISSMLISVTFCYGLEKKNIKVIWLSVIFLLMPLVNSRTGFALALIGFLIGGYFYANTRKFRVFLCSIPFLLIIAAAVMARLPESMISWITSGFQETVELLSGGGSTGVYGKIFSEDLILPPEILFGAGATPKELISYGVDNGYINCLWNFGLIGTILLLSGYAYMFYMAFKCSISKVEKSITISIAAIFFFYLIKVYSIDNFGGITVVFGLMTMIIGTARCRQLNE